MPPLIQNFQEQLSDFSWCPFDPNKYLIHSQMNNLMVAQVTKEGINSLPNTLSQVLFAGWSNGENRTFDITCVTARYQLVLLGSDMKQIGVDIQLPDKVKGAQG